MMVDRSAVRLAYFDQNLLSTLVSSGELKGFISQHWDEDVRLAYSVATIEEIGRIDAAARSEFLSYLDSVSPVFVSVDFESGTPTYQEILPSAVLDEYISNPLLEAIQRSQEAVTHKFSGGRRDQTFENLADRDDKLFESLISDIRVQTRDLVADEGDPELSNKVEDWIKGLEERKARVSNDLRRQVESLDRQGEEFNPLRDYRDLLSISPQEINNFAPETAVQSIWEAMDHTRLPFPCGTCDQFLDRYVFWTPDGRECSRFEKVLRLYAWLHQIGYWADRIQQKREVQHFRAHAGDQQHVAFASACHFLISADDRLLKKGNANYAHLRVDTRLIKVVVGEQN